MVISIQIENLNMDPAQEVVVICEVPINNYTTMTIEDSPHHIILPSTCKIGGLKSLTTITDMEVAECGNLFTSPGSKSHPCNRDIILMPSLTTDTLEDLGQGLRQCLGICNKDFKENKIFRGNPANLVMMITTGNQ